MRVKGADIGKRVTSEDSTYGLALGYDVTAVQIEPLCLLT